MEALLTLAMLAPTDPTPGHQAAAITRAAAVIPDEWKAFAACVADRESGGSAHARNPEAGSTASGRWQFIARDWQHSLPWMVAHRLRNFGMPAAERREIREYLDRTPIWQWPGRYQDIGFIAVIRAGERGEGRGWQHWILAGSRCNALAAS